MHEVCKIFAKHQIGMHEVCTAGIKKDEKSAMKEDYPSNKVCKTSKIVCKKSAKSLHFIKHTLQTYAHF
jgi:hypothetical protein